MIDLTPLDVRKKRGDFRRLLRGYDPEEVDTFMDLVAERFEELVRENLSLVEKTGRLETQLHALEGRENAVQEALVSAQKLREEVKDQSRRDAEVLRDQANREAKLLKAEAEAEVARLLGEAEGLLRERQRALEELERSRLKFLKSFRGLLERELDSVEVEESRRPLEDVPLELELRGWFPAGEGDDEVVDEGDDEGETEGEENSALGGEVVEVEADEVQAEEMMAPEAEPLVADAEHVLPEWEEPAEEAEEAMEAVEEAVVAEDLLEDPRAGVGTELPGGFETQILEASAPVGVGEGPAEEDPKEAPTHEPKWLFSLLKKEEEREEGR